MYLFASAWLYVAIKLKLLQIHCLFFSASTGGQLLDEVLLASLSPSTIFFDFFEDRGSPIFQWQVKRSNGQVACRTEINRVLKECFDTNARRGANYYTVVGIWHGGTSVDFHYSTEPLSEERELRLILIRYLDRQYNEAYVLLTFSERKSDSNSRSWIHSYIHISCRPRS